MRLHRLVLRNFKGITDFTFAPNGKSVSVFGDNRAGKTTLFDALCWLLFDKDSQGKSTNAFSIKTKQNGQVIHDIDHSVEGIFDSITLKKIYKEKWVKKRGAAKPVHEGHTTDYYLNDVPVKASDYQDAVSEIMSEDLFRTLTSTTYFAETMHWTDRRKVLLDLCGDISTEDIIADNPKLERYPDILDGKTHQDREKILNGTRKKINEQLESIPGRIDEQHGRLYEVSDVEAARGMVAALSGKKQAIEARRNRVEAGGRVAELNVERRQLEAEKQDLKNKHQQQVSDSLSQARKKVSELQDKVDEASAAVRDQTRVYHAREDEVERVRGLIDHQETEIEKISSRQPKENTGPDVCPVCERPMESDSDHSYEDYLKEFNAGKAAELKDAKQELRDLQDVLKTAQAELEEAKEKGLKQRSSLNQREQALKTAQSKLQEQKMHQQGFDSSDIDAQIAEIDQKIANHQAVTRDQIEYLEAEIANLNQQIEEAQTTIHQAKENERTQQRISELKGQQKSYQTELEQVEEDLWVLEQFTRAESDYITDRVNEEFEMVQWRLFEEQINGGIKMICQAEVDGIPFTGGLNNGHRIKAGLDIIDTLSGYYGESAPVFIDNAEGVTRLPEYDFQIIALYVSETDKTLRVEQGIQQEYAIAN